MTHAATPSGETTADHPMPDPALLGLFWDIVAYAVSDEDDAERLTLAEVDQIVF